MMDDAIYANLSQYIATRILKQPQRRIALEEKLISSGLIDSFNLVDLSIYIEDTFGVRIDDTELNADTFDTLAELTALIDRRQARS
jgi:acyl carrier protein